MGVNHQRYSLGTVSNLSCIRLNVHVGKSAENITIKLGAVYS